jgi:flagellar motor switch protein FliM
MIDPALSNAAAFNFRDLGRFSEDQLASLQHIHQPFIRAISSNLSAYLRSYVSGELGGVAQRTFADLVADSLSPVCMVYLKIRPYEEYGILEIHPALLAPVLDLLMGGDGKVHTAPVREMTNVEKDLLEGFLRIITRALGEAWKPVLPVEFVVDSVETKPRLSKRVESSQPVGMVSMQLRFGEVTGGLNLAIPSRIVKRLHGDVARKSAPQQSSSAATEHAIQQLLGKELSMNVDCDLRGSNMRLGDLLELKVGSVVDLGVACDSALTISVNGTPKLKGWLAQAGRRMTVNID